MNSYLKRAWAEIHLDRLKENVRELLKLSDVNKTAPMAVVKANAYGHDDMHIAPFLEDLGIKYFAVSNIKEAEKLRSCGCKGDILILGYTPPEYAPELEKHDIIQAAVSHEHAKALSDCAESAVKIHIAIDTGMGRIGISAENTADCAEEIKKIISLPRIVTDGIFTHYSCADSFSPEDIAYTNSQTRSFFDVKQILEMQGISLRHYHCLNSAGTAFHNDSRSTLSRLGIMLYGLKPDYELDIPFRLSPVMDLKAAVSYVKPVKAGSYISYGRTYRAEKDIIAATVPIGYADGLSRQLSGKASVIINGRKAPVIGRICMDQLIADVTEIPDVHAGTEVTVFGADCGQTADDLARLYDTIGYEIVCGISKRVPRVIIENGEITDIAEYY